MDFRLLKAEIEKAGQFAEIGGVECLNGLWDFVPIAENWQYYAAILADNYHRRIAIFACQDLEAKMFDPTTGAADEVVNDVVARTLTDLALRITKPVKTFREQVLETLEEVGAREEASRRGDYVEFGLPDLDEAIGGIEPGDLCVLSAATSGGKTALSLNLALTTVRRNQAVAIFSLEMRESKIIRRLLANDGQISMNSFKRSTFSKDELMRLHESTERLVRYPFWVERAFAITELVNSCRQLKLKVDLRLVIIDYLQLLQPAINRRETTREREVADNSRPLKEMALDLNLAILVLSQLNEQGYLRESRAIGHDADVILQIEEPDSEDSFERTIIVNKNRDGKRGQRCSVKFYGQYMHFGPGRTKSRNPGQSHQNSTRVSSLDAEQFEQNLKGSVRLPSRIRNLNSVREIR